MSEDVMPLRLLVEDYRQTERELTAWMRRYNHLKPLLSEADTLYMKNRIKELKKRRDTLKKTMENMLQGFPIYREYISYMWGFPIPQAAMIISYIKDPARFPTITKLWKYAGLAPGQSPHAGNKRYHVKLKTAVIRSVETMMLTRSTKIMELYRRFREQEDQKHPELRKAHRHRRAIRKVAKVLLYAIWRKWRDLKRLESTLPYAFEFLKHPKGDYIPPEWLLEKKHPLHRIP